VARFERIATQVGNECPASDLVFRSFGEAGPSRGPGFKSWWQLISLAPIGGIAVHPHLLGFSGRVAVLERAETAS